MLAITFNHAEQTLTGRVGLAFLLSFVIGFERELRGAPAGDRTYAIVGTSAAALTAVAFGPSPQSVAGLLTGIGFVGAALVFRGGEGMVRGITSAASVLAVVCIGIVVGSGHTGLGILVTLLVLVDLELRHIPLLRWLDSRRYVGMVPDDDAMTPMHDKGPKPT